MRTLIERGEVVSCSIPSVGHNLQFVSSARAIFSRGKNYYLQGTLDETRRKGAIAKCVVKVQTLLVGRNASRWETFSNSEENAPKRRTLPF